MLYSHQWEFEGVVITVLNLQKRGVGLLLYLRGDHVVAFSGFHVSSEL
ncbi:hypothetical protein ES703_36775 [subsurface metagenome]